MGDEGMFKQLTGNLGTGGAAVATMILAPAGALARLRPKPLEIYLNDHLLGATLGTELASRIAASHRLAPETLGRLSAEVDEDRTTLLELMAALDVPVRRYKTIVGWAAEKAARLKPNGRLLERSHLSDLEELEIMMLGVEGKAACWRTLRALAEHDDRLDAAEIDELLARARRQTGTLEELRVRTAERAIS
jgi:hypothetical protein